MGAPSSWSPLLILKLFLQYHAQILQFLKTFSGISKKRKKDCIQLSPQIFTCSN